MQANPTFSCMPKSFWAIVRTVSQKAGYTVRGKGVIRILTVKEITKAFNDLHLDTGILIDNGKPSLLMNDLISYYAYRADILNTYVKPRLMDVNRARAEFERLHGAATYSCPMPMNKQKGDKKAPAYFTCIINMLLESNLRGRDCDYDPRQLTTITSRGRPLRTLSRRVDGAFPSIVNPVSLWEIKEYYYTKTFGSRVADGVYEALLDGMELEELYTSEGVKVYNYLMIDDYFTWWDCGRSYLCRIIDMLHMGYLEEALFGYEVIERIPILINKWNVEDIQKGKL